MKQLNKAEIKRLDTLNKQLILVEELIYARAKEENQIVLKKLLQKEHNMWDYEIEAEIDYFAEKNDFEGKDEDDCLMTSLNENMKARIMNNTSQWGINDKQCHNTTSIYQKDSDLNSQKHCWLMHNLYDHCQFSWEKIFCIDNIYFDIKVIYQYETNFNL